MIKSGICLADISDHLPCFCMISTKLPAFTQASYYRGYSHFDRDLFKADLAQIDFCSLVITEDVNIGCNNIIQVLQDITDKHGPIRKVSNCKKRQLKKPWISNGILTFIKKKKCLRRTSSVVIPKKKLESNKLNKIKELSKQKYLSTQFDINRQH